MKPAEHFLAQCLVNSISRFRSSDRQVMELERVLLVQGSLLGIDVSETEIQSEDLKRKRRWLMGVRKQLEERLAKSPVMADDNSRLVDGLVEIFAMTPQTAKVFLLMAWQRLCPQFDELFEAMGISSMITQRGTYISQMATLLDLSDSSCRSALRPTSPLFSTGLLVMDDDGDISLSRHIVRILSVDRPPPEKLSEALIGESLRTDLTARDYVHLGEDWQYLLSLIKGAIRSRAVGVNILLYGEPGTGKTELCKALAAAARYPIYAAGRADRSGCEPSRSDRLAGLRNLQKLVGQQGQGLILIDEAQDIFGSDFDVFRRGYESKGSRVFMHELLESIPVPVLWTANAIDGFGGPVLRRMSYVLELKTPPVPVRSRIWKKHLSRFDIPHKASDANALATEYTLAPALAAASVRSASLARNTLADVRRAANSLGRATGHRLPISLGPETPFDPALIATDIDLSKLSKQLRQSKTVVRFSMCLSGPPGTGKSAYARSLARDLGFEVIHKRYSELSSKYVGESEKLIANAFEEAAAVGAMLILDEVDSLLADRNGARNSWEVTQVNEMLTWMESHPMPFVCTTNLMDRLDPAALRRFTFKVKMNYLTQVQIRHGFRSFFGVEAPANTSPLTRLTPGDLALVKKKASMLGCLDDPNQLHQLLVDEEMLKPDFRRPVGFTTA